MSHRYALASSGLQNAVETKEDQATSGVGGGAQHLDFPSWLVPTNSRLMAGRISISQASK